MRVGDIGIAVVQPVRGALRQLLPVAPILEHTLTAASVEFRHAGLFDELLAAKLAAFAEQQPRPLARTTFEASTRTGNGCIAR